jgi:hypothetical protein
MKDPTRPRAARASTLPLRGRDKDRESIMADGPSNVTRFLHVKFRAPTADTAQLLPLMKAALPMLEAMGARVRLMRNADDHAQFVQIIQYQTDPSLEASRQKVASDPMLRNYMQAWRAVFPGPMEMDVYEDVTDGG